ncbi:hypothetical protein JCM10212_005749 [Sporobolomyces blumeae]
MTKKEENAENICHWNACLLQFGTAEDLFNHVCSTHIGRKSAGTLSLECQWTGCHAKASKRDHLTSHCRVHIALKPHVCSICNKAFKRPQDLKKHEKIHTEEHHAAHKQAKAIIAPSVPPANASIQHSHSPQPPTFGQPHAGHPLDKAAMQPQTTFPFSFPALGYTYPFLQTAQTSMGQQLPNGMTAPVDPLAQYIAIQQQLNSQAHAAASQGLSLPGMNGLALPPGYPLQLGQNPYAVTAQGLSLMPQGVYSLPPHYPFSTAGHVQPQYAQVPLPQSHPSQPQPQSQGQQQQQQNGQAQQHRLSTASTTSLPPTSLTSTPAPSSLYPTLPSTLYPSPAAVPAIKAEDHPSPAHSSRSQYSSISSPSGVPALSPPSLSTPEHSYSPTPETDSDTSVRRSYSGNAVAGKKRGFDEAAGQFLGDLKNKRFQDQDSVNHQLDALSTFLLSPEMNQPPVLTPGRTADDSSSSNGSEHGRADGSFDREEVDTINQLLLSLGQSFDTDAAALQSTSLDHDPYSHSTLFSHQPDHASLTSLPPMHHNLGASLYPTLPSLHGKGFPSQPSYGSTPYTYPSVLGQDSTNQPGLRLSKAAAAPTISNDYRHTHYQHVARLQRAAPSNAASQEAMEVDDEMAEAANALLMGKSAPGAASTPTSSQRPTLPSLATAILGSREGPRLAPIGASASTIAPTSPPTLPHIRDILPLSPRRSSTEAPDSPTSPVSSGISSLASPPPVAAPSHPMYPSLSSTPSSSSSRPVSAGGVERLTHRVHKMRLPSCSSEASTSTDTTETGGAVLDTDDLGISSDEDDEDHPNARFKKSRIMDTPEPIMTKVKEEDEDDEVDQLDDDDEDEDVKPVLDPRPRDADEARQHDEERRIVEKRKATIAYLVGYVNAKYREALARRSVSNLKRAMKPTNAASSSSTSAPHPPSPFSSISRSAPLRTEANHVGA